MNKPTPKIPSSKQPQKTGKKKLNLFQKIFLFLSLMIVGFTVFPIVIVLTIGLLPTLTLILTDTKNLTKITTVGCFNISGVMICLNNLFNQISSDQIFSVSSNIFNIIIMLGGAALGVILYYILPDIFVFIFKNSSQHRLKVINSKLEKLAENWANILPEEH